MRVLQQAFYNVNDFCRTLLRKRFNQTLVCTGGLARVLFFALVWKLEPADAMAKVLLS